MARNSMSLDDELATFFRDQFEGRSKAKGTPRYQDELTSALNDAMTEAVARVVSQASPLERIVFLQALAPALADALAPALAEALAPGLMSALSSTVTPKKDGQEAGSAAEGARKTDKK